MLKTGKVKTMKIKIRTVFSKKPKQATIKESRAIGRRIAKDFFTGHPRKFVKDYQDFNVSGKRVWSEGSRKAFEEGYEGEKKKHWLPRWLR